MFLEGHIVAMVTCYATNLTVTCSPMVGHDFDIMILASIDIQYCSEISEPKHMRNTQIPIRVYAYANARIRVWPYAYTRMLISIYELAYYCFLCYCS